MAKRKDSRSYQARMYRRNRKKLRWRPFKLWTLPTLGRWLRFSVIVSCLVLVGYYAGPPATQFVCSQQWAQERCDQAMRIVGMPAEAASHEPVDPWQPAFDAVEGLRITAQRSCEFRRATGDTNESSPYRVQNDLTRIRITGDYEWYRYMYLETIRRNREELLAQPPGLPEEHELPTLCEENLR